MLSEHTRVRIRTDADIVAARQHGRALALELGFSHTDATLIATAISELARNIILYAKQGEVLLRAIRNSEPSGILIEAHDDGPGIADVTLAMRVGFSTSNSLGLGLPGVSRLMDAFQIDSRLGYGTTVVVKKWLR